MNVSRMISPLTLLLFAVLAVGAYHPVRAAAPLAQDYTVVFHNPDPDYYVEGPSLVRLDDCSLVAVVSVVPREMGSKERRAGHSVTHTSRTRPFSLQPNNQTKPQ